jgi:hypothetical protein
VRGRPGWSPGRLALVTVLQMAEDLTDRQAAEAVRERLSWQYALGLGLEDPGFDHSVLSEFRTRVVEHGLEERVLDLLLEALKTQGLVGAGGKQRSDSAHVISAVRDLNRLELAGESVRAALEALAVTAPDWLGATFELGEWGGRYRARVDSWRLPTSQTKRNDLALAYARDGYALLAACYAPDAPAWLRELPAVDVLRFVLLQNYLRSDTPTGWESRRREADTDGLPPGRQRLTSPYDTDARWAAKGDDLFFNGYKVHISETCDIPAIPAEPGGAPRAEPPNVITNVSTTDATVPDTAMTTPIHAVLDRRGLLPGEHYLDSGYPTAALVGDCLQQYGITLVSPLLADHSPQAKAPPATTGPASPSTSTPSGRPAHKARSAPGGTRPSSAALTWSRSSSPPLPAGPAPSASSAPDRNRRSLGVSSPCPHARFTTPNWPPAPSRTPRPGRPATPPAPASKAPSAKASPCAACATPATGDYPRPTSSTCIPPPHST